jgi:hypothetical protein
MAQVALKDCTQLKSNPGFYLRDDAAKAWDRAVAAFGKSVLLTGAWRSLETQVKLFDGEKFPNQTPQYGRYSRGDRRGQVGYTTDVRGVYRGSYWTRKAGTAAAAVPGTSNHGGGVSVDVKTRREKGDPGYETAVVFTSFGDADRLAFLKVANEHGWYDTEGRQVNEHWHLTYYPALDKHRGQTAPEASIPNTEEGFLMALNDRDQEALLWTARETKKMVEALSSVLKAKIKDGSGAAEPRAIWERTLDVSRRTLAQTVANQAAPVDVDVDAGAVADALLERLPRATAEEVIRALSDRLK